MRHRKFKRDEPDLFGHNHPPHDRRPRGEDLRLYYAILFLRSDFRSVYRAGSRGHTVDGVFMSTTKLFAIADNLAMPKDERARSRRVARFKALTRGLPPQPEK